MKGRMSQLCRSVEKETKLAEVLAKQVEESTRLDNQLNGRNRTEDTEDALNVKKERIELPDEDAFLEETKDESEDMTDLDKAAVRQA